MLPHYLIEKLARLAIYDMDMLCGCDYIIVFKRLREHFPSLALKTLFDLYCLSHNLPLNSLSKQLKSEILNNYKHSMPYHIPVDKITINNYLGEALQLANYGGKLGEVPIGAIVVNADNLIIGYGYNQNISGCDVSLHAEIVAMREAQHKVGSLRLTQCDLYVTVEPCLMCAGAIMQSRVRRLIFGAIEPKTGAVISQYQVFNNSMVNHTTAVLGPIDNQLYAAPLQDFFRAKRHQDQI